MKKGLSELKQMALHRDPVCSRPGSCIKVHASSANLAMVSGSSTIGTDSVSFSSPSFFSFPFSPFSSSSFAPPLDFSLLCLQIRKEKTQPPTDHLFPPHYQSLQLVLLLLLLLHSLFLVFFLHLTTGEELVVSSFSEKGRS